MAIPTSRAIWVTGIVGVVLLGFGIIWQAVVFDRYEEVPDDIHRIVDLEGTYTLVDTPFTDRLQANATITAMLQSGAAGELLSNPEIAGLLDNPGLAGLIANPAIVGLLASPGALAPLLNPTVGALLANPTALAALADPALLAALADPASLPALAAANPALGALLSDPAVLGLLADPAFSALLSSGVLGTLVANPEILALVTDPTFPAVLANPAVSALLADPEALALVLDPRTQRILANPADLPTVEIPVLIHRERKAERAEGDILYIAETLTTTNLIDGSDMGLLNPRFAPTEVMLAVDRVDKIYLPELMEPGTERSGQWGLPFHASKSTAYPSWISFAGQALDAVYDRSGSTNGLPTYAYVVDVESVALGAADPATGLPLVFDTFTVAWVEPNTGAGVDATVQDTISALAPDGSKYVRIANNLAYSDESVAALVDEAEGHKDDLVIFGTWLPIGSDIAGAALLLVALGLLLRRRSRTGATLE